MSMEANVPPPGTYPGAVDLGDSLVRFALYAPGKRSVNVIGSFNNWNRDSDPMQQSPDGLWWTEMILGPGIHEYQFAVDGEIIISDPYAQLLAEDAAFDPPRALVQVGGVHYVWRRTGWQRPRYEDLIIYEIHVGDFSPQGNFAGLCEGLEYLQQLGVNALELMPIFEFKGDRGWGYNPAYFFSVEKSYGEPDDLRRLIDEAHARGMAVILDIVLAHTAHRHPFNKLYPYDESPWYGQGCGELNQFGFPTLDYTRGPAQDFARDVERFWLNDFHVDGFRYDYCIGIGSCDGMGMPYLVQVARAEQPKALLVGEYSPEEPEEIGKSGLDGGWHVAGSYGLKALLCEGDVMGFHPDDFARCASVLNPWESGYQRAAQMVNYVESHDEQRLMNQMEKMGIDEHARWIKAALGASILYTMPGIPMLYHGQEWGESTEQKTNERNTLRWAVSETEDGRALLEHYRRLAALRREHPALRAEGYELDRLYPEQRALVYHRWNDEGDEVVVAANFSGQPVTIEVPFPRPARWLDVLSGAVIEAGEVTPATLGASTAAIWVKE